MGISQLLWVAKLQSAPVADNPCYATVENMLTLICFCVNMTDLFRPLMLNTQRLSSLAFNLRDGRVKDPSCLTAQMKQLAVRYQYYV